MYRLNYITLFVVQLLLFSSSRAQDELHDQEAQIHRQLELQRKKIDSLNKILARANDTERIDCYNLLSPEYYIFNYWQKESSRIEKQIGFQA